MQSIVINLNQPISQFVDSKVRQRKVSPQEAVMELLSLGFEALLHDQYQRYRQGEISFGRLAEELGVTTWELSHILEEHDWPAYNLPTAP